MIKRYILYLLVILTASRLQATVPTGYYTSAQGKNTLDLLTALKTIITNGHSVTSYAGLWTAYGTTDLNSSGKIWDIYSDCSFTYSTDQCGTYTSECGCYNREHTTPQSWFGEASPMVSDLFNVYPTDGKVNGMRANYPYGEVGTASYTSGNGSKLGTSGFSGFSGTVFEPIDEYKGDIARTYFYMATRYYDNISTWISANSGNTDVEEVYDATHLGLTTYAVNLFLKWSREDPVSAKEIARNDAVYSVQNNRNPFIDNPGLEEYIWGNKTSETFGSSTSTAPTVTTPASSAVTSSTATLGGDITSTGGATITESGVYYSTSSGFADGTGTKVTGTATTTGVFAVTASGLTASTTYYYKAFATNSAGTGYSEQGTFATIASSSGGEGSPTVLFGVIPSGNTLSFGSVTSPRTKTLLVKTTNVTGDLTVTLSGSMFAVSATAITQSNANSGYNLTVTYNPTALGTHTGTLTISGGGLSSYSISLSGTKVSN